MKKLSTTIILLAIIGLSVGLHTTVNAQTAYITNWLGNTVSVIDVVTNTVTATISVGTQPRGISVSTDGKKVYVVIENNNAVAVINCATNTVTANITVGSTPIGICVSPDGSHVYATNYYSNSVSVITTATNTVTATIPVGKGPFGVTVSPDGSKVYVTNRDSNSVSVISAASNTVAATIKVGTEPYGACVSPDGSKLYITNQGPNTISVINTTSNTVTATISVGNAPEGIAISPDGSKLYFGAYYDNAVNVLNTATNTVTTTIPVGSYPEGISITPDGSKVFAANNNGNTVSVINTATNTVTATLSGFNSPTSFGNFISTYHYVGCGTPVPIVTNASRCGAGSVTLNASGGTQYNWYNAAVGGSLIYTGASFNTPSLSTTTTYYVSNFDSCESARVPVTASVNKLIITANNDTTSCGNPVTINTTTTYNGSKNLSYSWSPATGLNSSTVANPIATLEQTTAFTVMVTDSVCTSYANVSVVVTPSNFGLSFTSNTQILYNPPFAFQFNNTTPNPGDYNFTWYFGDGSSLQSNDATVFHQYAQNGQYSITLVATSINSSCTETLFKHNYLFCAGGTNCTQSCNITPTGPVSACAGIPVKFTCNTVTGATYQWNYNGAIISGDTTTTCDANASGNYSATIILNGCPVTSTVVTVTMNNPPSVPVITSKGSLTYCGGGKDTLTAPAGESSYLWSNGATTQSTIVTTSGNYTVQVSNTNGCTSQSQPYLVGGSPLASPDICIVGVDSASGHNIVIWNKTVNSAINHYNVYSQGNVANVFNLIGSVPYDSMSTFIDTASNPAQQAYMYKLSAVDTCSAESALSSYHETIHLSINQGVGNTYNLMWNFYEGFSFPSYNIYRGTSLSNITLLKTLASTLNSFTDLTPPAGYVYYQIEAVNPNPCNPTARLLSSKNYNSSRSNIATNYNNNVITGLKNHSDNLSDINIYPNPASDEIQVISIQYSVNSIEIYNLLGERIYSSPITVNRSPFTIRIADFPSGVYIIEAKTDKGIVVKKFVKE